VLCSTAEYTLQWIPNQEHFVSWSSEPVNAWSSFFKCAILTWHRICWPAHGTNLATSMLHKHFCSTISWWKKVGISCTVFEQDTSFFQRPRDWNFGIYWAQSRLDECLTPELRALVETVQTDPTYTPSAESVMPIHNGETGELMKNLAAPWSLRLRRKKWLQMLSKNVDIQVRSSPYSSLQRLNKNCSGARR